MNGIRFHENKILLHSTTPHTDVMTNPRKNHRKIIVDMHDHVSLLLLSLHSLIHSPLHSKFPDIWYILISSNESDVSLPLTYNPPILQLCVMDPMTGNYLKGPWSRYSSLVSPHRSVDIATLCVRRTRRDCGSGSDQRIVARYYAGGRMLYSTPPTILRDRGTARIGFRK